MRLPIVALVALSSMAGLAAATAVPVAPAPIALPSDPFALASPLAALPSLATPARSLAAPVPTSLAAPVSANEIAMPALRAPSASEPVSPGAPVLLLLPDGFALLVAPRGSLDAVRLDAPALAPEPSHAALRLGSVAAGAFAPTALRAKDVAGAGDSSSSTLEGSASFASGHAYVAEASSVPARVAAAGAAIALAGVLGFALYHRIRPHAALENDTRKQIFDAVCASPGLGVHAIAQVARVSYSTATYHLERLVAAGMIVMTPDGNKLCYYKNGGAFTEAERKILPLVKNDEASKLLEAILDSPGTYRAALAERLGVTATTINWHLRRLREAGLIEELRQGRNAYLSVRIATVRESFLSLAQKVDATDADAAQRLRRFAAAEAPQLGASGA